MTSVNTVEEPSRTSRTILTTFKEWVLIPSGSHLYSPTLLAAITSAGLVTYTKSTKSSVEELKELMQACHDRDIWLMVVAVANHIGYVENFDYSSIVPLDNESYLNP